MQIIIAPDSRLNQIAKKVDVIDKSILLILDEMLECMYKNNAMYTITNITSITVCVCVCRENVAFE